MLVHDCLIGLDCSVDSFGPYGLPGHSGSSVHRRQGQQAARVDGDGPDLHWEAGSPLLLDGRNHGHAPTLHSYDPADGLALVLQVLG